MKLLLVALAGSSLLVASSLASSPLQVTPGAQAPVQRGSPSGPTVCADGVTDASNPANCISASSSPTLGSLYPLSNNLFVSNTGSVGIGTTQPFARLEVVGRLGVAQPASVFKALVRPSTNGEFGVIQTLSTTGFPIPTVTTLVSASGIDTFAGAMATFRDTNLLTALTTPTNDSNSGYVAVRNANVEVAGINGATGTVFGSSKSFVQPHPFDSAKEIRFVSLEGPEHGVYFRGTARLSGGRALVATPESFRLVARKEGLTVSLTPLGPNHGLYVASKGLGEFEVRENEGGAGNVAFDFLVMGERSALPRHQAIVENAHFAPAPGATIPAGRLPGSYRELMIQNGTLDQDGAVNEANATSLGWRREGGRWVGREDESARLAEQGTR